MPLDEEEIDDLLFLARTGEIDEFQAILQELSTAHALSQGEILTRAVDPITCNNLLHMICANGHHQFLQLILQLLQATSPESVAPQSKIDLINAPNDSGNTALHWAALNGRLDIVQTLVSAGAQVTLKNKAGHEPAFAAESAGKGEVATWLQGAGAPEQLPDRKGGDHVANVTTEEGGDSDIRVTQRSSESQLEKACVSDPNTGLAGKMENLIFHPASTHS